MPIDHPDPVDDSGATHPPDRSHPPDQPRPPDHSRDPDGGARPSEDPANRAAAHQAYRAQVDQVYAAGGAADRDDKPSEAGRPWAEAVPALRTAWEVHQERYPERVRAVPQTHPDNSWSSGDTRQLSPDQNDAVNRGYAHVCDIGERDIVPGMLTVEAEDPGRHLAGFDRHIKGSDRLKEKVADRVRTKGQTPDQALAGIPDAVRFTFQYNEITYTAGVQDDVKRLEGRGFTQVERRNTWDDDQYKGINSRWREPKSGVLFEVQFHTQASLEAKELTHQAYERIRSTVQDGERVELKDFQRRVNSAIPLSVRLM